MRESGSFKKRGRTIILILFVVSFMLFYYYRLMQLQIVRGDYYSAIAERSFSSSTSVPAARGEILDRYGRPIAVNNAGFSICFQKNFIKKGEENNTIFSLINLLTETGEGWNDTLPITKEEPFAFKEGEESSVEYLKKKLRLNSYATTQNCLDALYESYDLEESEYSPAEKRFIAGVRYEMDIREFAPSNDFVFADDVSNTTAAKIEELSYLYSGVVIKETLKREYVEPTLAPHLVGVVGAMNADEYETLKTNGYKMNDSVGKFGAEKAFENYLKGTDGTRLTVQDQYGNITSVSETKEAVPGNSVMLTIDLKLQEKVQEIIESHVEFLKTLGKNGKDVTAITMVVLDVEDGGVLAMAQTPSFDLSSYYNDYSTLISDKNQPLFNRATNGLYRPGSTFKVVTSLAGLCEGVITPSSTITCRHVYDYYEDYRPTCLGTHGAIDVSWALGYSCNVFYYEAGRRLGISNIVKYAGLVGYAQKTGIEIDEATGRISSPETSKYYGKEWYNGDVLQAAIGQGETTVTPLQMASCAMTIATGGTRYQAHILKEVKSFDLSETISEYEPVVAQKIEADPAIFTSIKKGMINSANQSSTNYGLTGFTLVQAAIKTGTPQVTEKITNHCTIGFAPADNPKIAFAVMQEGGAFSAMIIKDVLSYYFTEESAASPETPGTLLN